MGKLTGKSYADIDNVEMYLINPELEQEVEGLEPVEEVHKKVREFLKSIQERQEENISIVTHSSAIQPICRIIFSKKGIS